MWVKKDKMHGTVAYMDWMIITNILVIQLGTDCLGNIGMCQAEIEISFM